MAACTEPEHTAPHKIHTPAIKTKFRIVFTLTLMQCNMLTVFLSGESNQYILTKNALVAAFILATRAFLSFLR
jgi:hypothetical protein